MSRNRGGTCSTPYGNQRKITRSFSDGIVGSSVCSTPYGNQRKITHRLQPQRQAVGHRAQRLTAIRGKSQLHALEQSLPRRCSTPYGNQRKITREQFFSVKGQVFSAQRLTAIRGKSPSLSSKSESGLNQCSTPYGNQRKITVLPKGELARSEVLNALRQSEENHRSSERGVGAQ